MLCSFSYVSPTIREKQLRSRISDLQSKMLDFSRIVSPSKKIQQNHCASPTNDRFHPPLREVLASIISTTGSVSCIAWPLLFPTFTYLAEGCTNFFWITSLVCLIITIGMCWKTILPQKINAWCLRGASSLQCPSFFCTASADSYRSARGLRIIVPSILVAFIFSTATVVMLIIHSGGIGQCPCWCAILSLTWFLSGFFVSHVLEIYLRNPTLPVVNYGRQKSGKTSVQMSGKTDVADQDIACNNRVRKLPSQEFQRTTSVLDAQCFAISPTLFIRYPVEYDASKKVSSVCMRP